MKKPHWPDRWDERKGAIYYRPKASERDQWEGKYYYRLGATEQEAYAKWFEIFGENAVPRTIREAAGMYRNSSKWAKLSERSKRDYSKAIDRLVKVFGNMEPRDLMPADVYRYMELRPNVAGNREKAVLSNIMQTCVRRGACTHNIVRDVESNPEESRDRYVSDEEIDAFLKHCTPFLRSWVELKLMTGLRQGQMRELRRQDWDGERLTVGAAKRGRKIIYTGPGLKEAIDRVLAVRAESKYQSIYLFCTRKGTKYTPDGFRNLWQYAMVRYVEAGGERFTEHDLRAKVASDSETVIQAYERMGHQDLSTTKRVYRRAPQNVTVLRREQ
jgi:integrase